MQIPKHTHTPTRRKLKQNQFIERKRKKVFCFQKQNMFCRKEHFCFSVNPRFSVVYKFFFFLFFSYSHCKLIDSENSQKEFKQEKKLLLKKISNCFSAFPSTCNSSNINNNNWVIRFQDKLLIHSKHSFLQYICDGLKEQKYDGLK